MPTTQISLSELKAKSEKLDAGELILDVRSAEEFAQGHIRGAKNVSHEKVGEAVEELKKFFKIYIHCRAGRRASEAAATLESLGFKNLYCLSNSGMAEWESLKYPIQK